MISKIVLSLLIISSLFHSGYSQKLDEIHEPGIESIIDNYVKAVGGYDAVKQITNLHYSRGTYKEGSFTSDGKAMMTLSRPYYKLVGNRNDTTTDYLEGYDGSAWEYYKSPGIVLRTTGKASEAIRHYAGVEHPLIDYKVKGSNAKYLGVVELENRNTYVIQLERRDGFIEQFYIDMETSLIIGSSGEVPIHAFGDAVKYITKISDYRMVGNVLIPHKFEDMEINSGKTLSSMEWGDIASNIPLPSGYFSPPEFNRHPIQKFIEDLFIQREDFNAMKWTYDEFRNANPNTSTEEAVNIASYQILKMGNTDQALALLCENIKDYPNSVETLFGLGRAFRAANKIDEAIRYFKKALTIDPNHSGSTSNLKELIKE